MTITSRHLAATALVGFVVGAFTTSVVVWHAGNIAGSREASWRWPADPPPSIARWGSGPEIAPVSLLALVRPAALPASPARGEPAFPPPPERGDPLGELRARGLQVPVEGVKADELRASFNDRRGPGREHEAIDILAPRHTPVLAVEDGSIARLFESRAGGLTVYQFDPSGEYVYYYAHLEGYAAGLRESDPVKRGQVLGYVGTSGNAPKDVPHLHFAIARVADARRWWGGEPVDPFEALRPIGP
jgi:murein DD-endopeptidase MepM/ murein hydrolase activator NlpD